MIAVQVGIFRSIQKCLPSRYGLTQSYWLWSGSSECWSQEHRLSMTCKDGLTIKKWENSLTRYSMLYSLNDGIPARPDYSLRSYLHLSTQKRKIWHCREHSDFISDRIFIRQVKRTNIKSLKSSTLSEVGPFTLEVLAIQWRKFSHRLIMEKNVVRRTMSSLLIDSSSNLKVTRTAIKSRTSSNSGQIGFFTSDYLPLRAEKHHIWLCPEQRHFISNLLFTILAGNKDSYKISDNSDFGPDRTIHFVVTCPWVSKMFPGTYNGEK